MLFKVGWFEGKVSSLFSMMPTFGQQKLQKHLLGKLERIINDLKLNCDAFLTPGIHMKYYHLYHTNTSNIGANDWSIDYTSALTP